MFVFGGNVKKTAELTSPILREIIYHVYACTSWCILYFYNIQGVFLLLVLVHIHAHM